MTVPFPFKGIMDRPYDQELLSTAEWSKIIPVPIKYADIWLTQRHLNIVGVLGAKFSTDQYVRVVSWHKNFYLEDGHHRLVLRARAYPLIRIVHCRVLHLHDPGHGYRECSDPWECIQHQMNVEHTAYACLNPGDCHEKLANKLVDDDWNGNTTTLPQIEKAGKWDYAIESGTAIYGKDMIPIKPYPEDNGLGGLFPQ